MMRVRCKSTVISGLDRLSSRRFWPHQWTSISSLWADSSLSWWIRPMAMEPCAIFMSFTDWSAEVWSFMYRKKSSGERTHLWGAPVLVILVQKRKDAPPLVIHWRVGAGAVSWWAPGGERQIPKGGGVEDWAEVQKQDPGVLPCLVKYTIYRPQVYWITCSHVYPISKLQEVEQRKCVVLPQHQSLKGFHDHRHHCEMSNLI